MTRRASIAHRRGRSPIRPAGVASRVSAALVGGWVFVWGGVTLGIALLLRSGMTYADAKTLCYLLAFLVYVVALCWTFATATAWRAWVILAGSGAIMTALGWWVAPTLV